MHFVCIILRPTTTLVTRIPWDYNFQSKNGFCILLLSKSFTYKSKWWHNFGSIWILRNCVGWMSPFGLPKSIGWVVEWWIISWRFWYFSCVLIFCCNRQCYLYYSILIQFWKNMYILSGLTWGDELTLVQTPNL